MSAARRSALFLTLLIFVAFISLGLPDGLLGVAAPSIRGTFHLPIDAIGMIFITGTAGYFLSSISSGRLLAWLGVGRLLALSSLLTATALIGNAIAPVWGMMVALGFVSGLGAGAIDAGLNTYVAANRSERMMQWLHASFGVGMTLGPLIMTGVIDSGRPWRIGYAIVGVAQIVLAVAFAATASMWRGDVKARDAAAKAEPEPQNAPSLLETARLHAAWISAAIFAIYASLEYSVGQWSYTLFTESRGIAEDVAGVWVATYWGMFTLGRIMGGVTSARLGMARLLQMGTTGAIAGTALLWWNPFANSGVIAVGLLGFSLAPIFPALISTTAQRVGARHAPNTIGFEVGAASAGISIIPALLGVMADAWGLDTIEVALFVMSLMVLGLYSLIRLMLARREERASLQSAAAEAATGR
ncbi:MAG TPA: MFS transporter [Aggregatilinea sp.]|jgi:fucose permease|uniref:MFS transporter n=1 Tax=Aggregatilinea sp. TaxID=2806333 RepID=UPI002CC83610|nr:MFS transporter [Aggregatilinea sp.]HML20752.1 MFS transporter [Aggregatilinea sp.]